MRNRSRDKTYWLLIGLILRFIVMPLAMHPDILHIYYHPYFLASKGVWDIYSYQADFFKEHRYHYYAPFTYLFLGSYLYLIRPFLPQFDTFMEDVRHVTDQGGGHSGHYLIGLSTKQHLFRFLFLMKLPYLLFDLGLLGLLVRFNQGIKMGKWWALNPVFIYVSYLFGQFDVIPTFLIVLAVYLAFKGKNFLAMIFLGFGAGLKNFPLFLILPMAVYLGRGLKGIIKYTLLGLLPLLAILIPYYFLSEGKVMGAFFSQRISGRLGLLGRWGTLRLSLFMLGYLILNLSFLKESVRRRLGALWPVKISFFILALLFITMPISFHYFIWITPLVLILAGSPPHLKRILWLYGGGVISLGLATVVGKNMWLGLFSPIYPEFFMGFPGLDEIIKRILPYHPVQQFSLLCFSGILIWISILIWREKGLSHE